MPDVTLLKISSSGDLLCSLRMSGSRFQIRARLADNTRRRTGFPPWDMSRRRPSSCPTLMPPYGIIKICHFEVADCMSDVRKVFCVKLQKELPGLDEPPFDTDLGKKIYESVSRDAWNMWMEHCKMLLNEYRLNPARKEDQQVIVNQLEQYFFGEGSALPKEYVPPSQK